MHSGALIAAIQRGLIHLLYFRKQSDLVFFLFSFVYLMLIVAKGASYTVRLAVELL